MWNRQVTNRMMSVSELIRAEKNDYNRVNTRSCFTVYEGMQT